MFADELREPVALAGFRLLESLAKGWTFLLCRIILRSLPLGDSAAFICYVPSNVGITVEGKERKAWYKAALQPEGRS